MAYLDTVVVPALRRRGVGVVDLRAWLPRNTDWPRLKQWSTRPVAAIQLCVWHYPALPLRPPLPYAEPQRLADFARGHINANWGNDYHAPTLTYHLSIGGSGVVYLCNDLEYVTWHASDANGIAVGVLVDVGAGQPVLAAQVASMAQLADVLTDDCPDMPLDTGDHYGHGEPAMQRYGNATSCPGNVQPYVTQYRISGHVAVPPPEPTEQDMQGIIDELNAQIEALRAEIAGLNSQLGALRAHELAPALAKIQELEAALAAAPPPDVPGAGPASISLWGRVRLADGNLTPPLPIAFEANAG